MRLPAPRTALAMMAGLLGTVHLAVTPLAYASWTIDALWFVGTGIAAGVDPERIYQDSISGARDCRPGLNACLAALATGDTLAIWKLDRLGRSLRHRTWAASRTTSIAIPCHSSPSFKSPRALCRAAVDPCIRSRSLPVA